jgi:formyltetrahydrofolate synthetase
MCDYSIIEGCIRQSSKLPMKTEDHDKTMKTFYDCTEEIANVIEKYYPEVYIEDMDKVNTLLQEEINEAKRKQAQENYLENINGGSK